MEQILYDSVWTEGVEYQEHEDNVTNENPDYDNEELENKNQIQTMN